MPCGLEFLQETLLQCFIHCLALCFVIKTEILPIIIGFLLQTKNKAADKTLEQHFLKEFKATCEKSGESEIKQQKAI